MVTWTRLDNEGGKTNEIILTTPTEYQAEPAFMDPHYGVLTTRKGEST